MRLELSCACDEDIRKGFYVVVVLPGGIAMSQGIGEQLAKECDVSCVEFFCFPVAASVEVSLSTKCGVNGDSGVSLIGLPCQFQLLSPSGGDNVASMMCQSCRVQLLSHPDCGVAGEPNCVRQTYHWFPDSNRARC